MSTPLKAIYRFNTIPSECKCHFPQKWKNQSKNHMEVQKTQMAEAYPKQKITQQSQSNNNSRKLVQN
jgi:hypothetical protein